MRTFSPLAVRYVGGSLVVLVRRIVDVVPEFELIARIQ